VDDNPAIRITGLTFNYGRLKAIDNLSLEITRGVSYGLLGPNGSGKTTLIRILVGIILPRAGEISMLGQRQSADLSQQIGYMPQLPALYNELSVTENITFFGQIYGLNDSRRLRGRVEEVIKLVDLWSKRAEQVMNLSGGMKQRVSLACALVHDPVLMFLDEPTVGMDPELRVLFWEYFRQLTQRGTTVVISSHTMDDAARCDRLVFLRSGKVIANGTPDELKSRTSIAGADLETAFLYFARLKEKSDVS
jgi:ABC-2 type transport system ATP-binding protein